MGQDVTLLCPCANLAGDNFNDNSKDPAVWGTDRVIDGNGVLAETNQTLRYTVGSATELDYTTRPWIAGVMPYDADWTTQIDVVNTTITSNSEQSSSFGISIFDENNLNTEAYVELYSTEFGGPPTYRGFYAGLYTDGNFVAEADSFAIDGLSSGTVRASFDADTKVVTFSYDVNTANSTVFLLLGSFGLDGNGGADGNSNWGLGNSDRLVLSVYGYSENMTIPAGTLFGDNFEVTGAVNP